MHIIELSDLKLRPIVAGPICPTRPLSNLIDIILKLFLLHVKSYVKDNLDFLSKYSRENDEDTLLVTFDVVNLYINIPHTFVLEALDYLLENHPEGLHTRFNKKFVLERAKFILQNNNIKSTLNFKNKLKVQQWVQFTLQLKHLYRWDILKSRFIVSALLSMKSF